MPLSPLAQRSGKCGGSCDGGRRQSKADASKPLCDEAMLLLVNCRVSSNECVSGRCNTPRLLDRRPPCKPALAAGGGGSCSTRGDCIGHISTVPAPPVCRELVDWYHHMDGMPVCEQSQSFVSIPLDSLAGPRPLGVASLGPCRTGSSRGCRGTRSARLA